MIRLFILLVTIGGSFSCLGEQKNYNFYAIAGIKSIDMKPSSISDTFGLFPWEEDSIAREAKSISEVLAKGYLPITSGMHFAQLVVYSSDLKKYALLNGAIRNKSFERVFFTSTFENELNLYMKKANFHVFVSRNWKEQEYLIDLVEFHQNSSGQFFIAEREFIELYNLSSKVKKLPIKGKRDSACKHIDLTDDRVEPAISMKDQTEDFWGVKIVSESKYCLNHGVLFSDL